MAHVNEKENIELLDNEPETCYSCGLDYDSCLYWLEPDEPDDLDESDDGLVHDRIETRPDDVYGYFFNQMRLG